MSLMEEKNKQHYLSLIDIDVSLLSFMTVVVMFFNGLLLTRFDSFDEVIKVPISFLIISTFSFLFSTLILSNSTQKLIDNKFTIVKKHLLYGYVISEYLGIYLFVISLPLVINIITDDVYLRTVTLIAALLGLIFYHHMGFSLLRSHFPKKHKFFFPVIILFTMLLYLAQILNLYFIEISALFLCVMFFILYAAPRKHIK